MSPSQVKPGQKVVIEFYFSRPAHWNQAGEQDQYMSEMTNVRSVEADGTVRIDADDGKYAWKPEDLVYLGEK